GAGIIEEFDHRHFRLGRALPGTSERSLDRRAVGGKHRGELRLPKRFDGVGEDLGIGEQAGANDFAAEDSRSRDEKQRRRQDRAHDSTSKCGAEQAWLSGLRRSFGPVHWFFGSRYFLSFLASSARDTMAMSCARR